MAPPAPSCPVEYPSKDDEDAILSRHQEGFDSARLETAAIQRVLDVSDPLDGQQRPEDLIAEDRRVRGQARHDGGGAEPAAPVDLRLARGDDHPLVGREFRVAQHPPLCLLVDERSDIGAEDVGLADLKRGDGTGDAL